MSRTYAVKVTPVRGKWYWAAVQAGSSGNVDYQTTDSLQRAEDTAIQFNRYNRSVKSAEVVEVEIKEVVK